MTQVSNMVEYHLVTMIHIIDYTFSVWEILSSEKSAEDAFYTCLNG